jgi:hypothetical protein
MPVQPRGARALAFVVVVMAAIFAGFLPVVSGQSLGDVAKKEEQRRKAVKSSGKVYTNRDLGPGGTRPPAPPPAIGPDDQSGVPAAQASPAGGSTTPEDDAEDPTRTEEYWRGRVEAARADLQRQELFLEALQSRVNALSTDFVNRDDPAQRALIADDRQRALAEMERVKDTIGKIRQQLGDIEEEARRAGVPAGWVR